MTDKHPLLAKCSQLHTLQDIEERVGLLPQIDTVRYRFYPQDNTVYVALWASVEIRGYGGCTLEKDKFDQFRNIAKLNFVEF